jgi:hypothetical protein
MVVGMGRRHASFRHLCNHLVQLLRLNFIKKLKIHNKKKGVNKFTNSFWPISKLT